MRNTGPIRFSHSVLWERPGCGARSPAKAGGQRRGSRAGFAVKWSGRKRGTGFLKSCSPFSAAKCHGKNPDGQGFKGGDFFAACAEKYDPALDGLDRRNGAKCGLLFDNEYGIIFASTD